MMFAAATEGNRTMSSHCGERKPRLLLLTAISDLLPVRAHLNNLVDQLAPICSQVIVVSGADLDEPRDNVRLVQLTLPGRDVAQDAPLISRLWTRTSRLVSAQLIIARHMWWMSDAFDAAMFYVGTLHYVVPMICAKLRGNKVILVAAGSPAQDIRSSDQTLPGWITALLSVFYALLEGAGRFLADGIGAESPAAVELLGLERWRAKTGIYGSIHIDMDLCQVTTHFADRADSVGLIARLMPVKGPLEFVEAIPKILKARDDVQFLIGGDGVLFEHIEAEIREAGLTDKVRLLGWIPYRNISAHLNELRLLVLPSYSEGLPVIVIYAMACGTVPLATSVGGIPDLITDGVTGFIMEDNSPECIAKTVVRALRHPGLERIALNARRLAETQYSYETCVERMRKALAGLISCQM
jgi:glycosyltransferase involved in cell wall biosynthesis